MTIVLGVGNSFEDRAYTQYSIFRCLEGLGTFTIYNCKNEGKGICSYWSEKPRRERILNAAEKHKPDYILLEGGIPNSAWHVAGVKLCNEIKKRCNAEIVICTHHHVGQSDSETIRRVKALAKAVGGFALPINKYYKELGFKESDYVMPAKKDNHPTFVCYYIAAVSLYCHITKKKPSSKPTYRTIKQSLRAKIVDIVAKDYGISTAPKHPTAYLKLGTKNIVQVKMLQKCLNYVTGSKLKVDGVFGRKTENVLMAFQKSVGLKINGRYGEKTKAALISKLKIRKE